ncbi:MAG: hypothetical protein GEU74_15575 [Nitriliruptorales bacterium]|nr:hypothetical protein [Nitriliruptorales bacterium]
MERLYELARRNHAVAREVVLFLVIGIANTALFFVVYNILRSFMSPFQANAVAVTVGALLSFYANRRFTFGVRGRERSGRQLVEFSIVFGVTLLMSSGALKILTEIDPTPSRLAENFALLLGSGVAITARFLLLRQWVFRAGRHEPSAGVENEHVLT